MKIFETIIDIRIELENLRKKGKVIGFVPTMGALHQGHMSLISRCKSENDVCVVSIFVNPTQFNNSIDLEKYPRTLAADTEKLEKGGCDIVFVPKTSEMYNAKELNTPFTFDFGGLDKVMEGKFRPGHFNGVVQIVSKFFSILEPQKAYFGEKDYQQLSIIHRMVDVMKFKTQIVDCEIVRESSGLALSSRNDRLTPQQRKNAVEISKVLFESRNFAKHMTPLATIIRVIEKINQIEDLRVEYFEIVDCYTLQPLDNWSKNAIGCIAVFCGDIRLIDNIKY